MWGALVLHRLIVLRRGAGGRRRIPRFAQVKMKIGDGNTPAVFFDSAQREIPTVLA